jgi:ribosomal protein S24E
MEMNIIEEKDNALFNRKEIILEIISKVSPKNEDVLNLVSDKFSTPPERIKIKGIYGKFGSSTFNVFANIYNTIIDKEKTEIKTKKERDSERKAFEERIKSEAELRKKSKEEIESEESQ